VLSGFSLAVRILIWISVTPLDMSDTCSLLSFRRSVILLMFCITTCIGNGGTTRIWHVTVRWPPPCPHLRSARPLKLRYISHVGVHILFVNITIFFVNDTFYVIQFFYSSVGHDGGLSSHRNELTLRDSSGHSNQLNADNTWAIWWLVWIVHDMWCEMWDLCEFDDCVNCDNLCDALYILADRS
jgi:hypothetical protein